MQHPVFQNLKTFIIYLGIWILLAVIQFSILTFQYNVPLWIAVTDSLVFNLLFALVGLPLWFVVRYSSPAKKSIFNIIFNHLTTFALIIVIWFGLCYTILLAIFQDIPAYWDFLVLSIPVRLISGLLLYLLLGLTFYLLIYNYNLQEKLQQEARLNTLLKESELNMLKSQINPHFLFNSLNSISSLTTNDAVKAREMVIKLSDFLRYSVSTSSDTLTTMDVELENIIRYLEIEKVRFGEKLQYDFQIGEGCLKRPIPVMILQPLFENAIKHGVYESTEQVTIHAGCTVHKEYSEITIVNDFDPKAVSRKGAGLGLKNIRERMRLTYQQDDLLKTWVEGNKYHVQLKVPV